MDKIHILLVEDDPLVAEQLQLELAEPEFLFVGIVDNAEALITRVREEKIDLLIVDIVLAGPTDGIDAVRRIREFSDIPVIYHTAYDRLDFMARAEATDPSAYLLKPFRKQELCFTIKMTQVRWKREKELKEARHEAEQRMWHMATHDSLTSLPNRTLLLDRLDYQLAHSRRNESSFAVFFTDIDNFKVINDSYGHDVGDRVLSEIASRMHNVIRNDDTLARIGGDEFILVAELPSGEEFTGISILFEKINDTLSKPVELEDQSRHLSISCGIAIYPKDGNNASMLLQKADTAMYRAKKSKGHSLEYYSEELTQKAKQHLSLETALIEAIDDQQFELHYQPQYCIKTKEIRGVEALIRWNRPGVGLVSPMEFIPHAEESGLITPITVWVFKQAFQQMKDWLAVGLPLESVAVNLSPAITLDHKFQAILAAAMESTGCPANKVELELTESHLMDTRGTSLWLEQLKSLGVKLSIDDFGTGFSSLGYLKKLPVDKLKIDKSFVEELPHDQASVAITRTILALAKNLNLKTVAEGIEKEEQHQLLKDEGCDIAQGYLFARPMPAAELEKLFASR